MHHKYRWIILQVPMPLPAQEGQCHVYLRIVGLHALVDWQSGILVVGGKCSAISTAMLMMLLRRGT